MKKRLFLILTCLFLFSDAFGIAPMALQNFTISKNQYVIASDVTAGNSVDNDRRTGGEVIVKGGVEYEIEASGTVTLQDGFKVEKGATFAVYRSCF